MVVQASSYAIIAFFVEFVTRSLAQYGFLLQKLAHRDLEKQKEQALELDNVNAGKTYCSGKWVVGFVFVTANVICHSLILPFIDLTLLACNAATAIIVNMLLSTKILNEKFVWKYDATAMLLIASGSVIIALQAHTEQVDFNAAEIQALLLAPKTLTYLAICICLFLGESCMLRFFIERLRDFERDAFNYQRSQLDNERQQTLVNEDQVTNAPDLMENRILPSTPRSHDNHFFRATVDDINVVDAQRDQLVEESKYQRPAHQLIEVLNDIDPELLEQASSRSTMLKTFVKIPMLYMLLNAGLQSGLSIVFLKLFGELIQSGDAGSSPVMIVTLAVLMAISAVSQTHSLNMAMKNYDQLEVMPIFQAMIMMMWMMGGMIVLNETQYYSNGELGGIAAAFCVSCIGIKVLTMKLKHQKQEKSGKGNGYERVDSAQQKN